MHACGQMCYIYCGKRRLEGTMVPAEAEAAGLEVAVAKRRSGVSKKSGPSGVSGRSLQQGRSNWPIRLLARKSPRKTKPRAKTRDACTCNPWWALTVCVPPPGTPEHEARLGVCSASKDI